MDLIFEKADLNRLNGITEMAERAKQAMLREGIDQWDDIYPNREDFEEDIKNGQAYLGCKGGLPVVYFTINRECDEQYLRGSWIGDDHKYCVVHRLFVDPALQGMGIGRKSLEYIENTVSSMGYGSIRLDVFSLNPHALRLYTNAGYEARGYADWRKGRFVLMEKQL